LLALLLPSAHAQTVRTGTGFAVSVRTLIVTNAHVAKGCRSLRVLQDGTAEPARLVALDDRADLAVLRTDLQTPKVAALRVQPPVRLGENVVSFGFPLFGSLSKEGNLTTGNVSALAGLKDDPTYFQITAPVQPGNSGGPLMDEAGNVIGVVTSKLDALKLAQRIGDIPQNVNFAIKAQVLKRFLDNQRLSYSEQVASEKMAVADVADLARGFTVQVECSPASSAGQVEQPEQPAGATPAPSPAPAPVPPPAPAGPPATTGLPDWIRAVSVVDAKTPFPASAPNTRQLTLANGSDRRIYEVTIAWVGVDTPEPCNVARERFGGQRTLYANLPPGGRTTIFADFPPAARAFCVVDAKASAAAGRRAPTVGPAEKPDAPSAPPEGGMPAPAQPETPPEKRE
jgi:S1-C subfamily serine protease